MSEAAPLANSVQSAPITAEPKNIMANLVSLCKRRGFVFQASEIYGGLNGFWDYGPLGTALKNNIRDAWWRDMVECPPIGPDGHPLQIFGLDSSIIQNPKTWVASGHATGFSDQMVDCRASKLRYRADHVLCQEIFAEKAGQRKSLGILAVQSGDDAADILSKRAQKLVRKQGGGDLVPFTMNNARPYTALSPAERALVIGPDADEAGTLTEPRAFNMMFETYVGALQDEDSKAWLRPETAQGIFLNYKNILDTMRAKVPFGVAQVGKAFRNEITPRNFIFRSREFEQMEMEFFCEPEKSREWYEFWVQARLDWWVKLGVAREKLYRNEIAKADLAHYSQACSDIEYLYPFTAPNFGELEGVAHRGNFDLSQHTEHSRVKLDYFEQEGNLRFVPHVIEPASGLTRAVLVMLCEAYHYDASRASPEILRLPARIAPIKLGIFPLVNKDGMPEMAEKLYLDLRQRYTCQYDAKQTIGKRYARMDEAGTPFCLTIDGDSLSNNDVTVRERDSGTQQRVNVSQLQNFLTEKMS